MGSSSSIPTSQGPRKKERENKGRIKTPDEGERNKSQLKKAMEQRQPTR